MSFFSEQLNQLQEFKTYFNLETKNDLFQIDKINYIIDVFCKKKANFQIICNGRTVCGICKLFIHSNGEYYVLKENCSCMDSFHSSCLLDVIYSLIKNNKNANFHCQICHRIISLNELERLIGTNNMNELKRKADQQKIIENRDKEFAKMIDLQTKNELTKQATFTCSICSEEKIIDKDCITLIACDHKFCKECLRENFLVKIKEKKINSNDFKCFECEKEISISVLSGILTKEEFQELQTILNRRLNPNTFKSKEIIVKCTKAECDNFFFLDPDSKLTHHICELCGTDFCVRGCPKPHRPKTCMEHAIYLEEQRKIEEERRRIEIEKIQEQQRKEEELRRFNAWKEEQIRINEDLFNQLAQNEKLGTCPNCHAKVQKISGCNYIRCICTYEFCYVCSSHYPNHVRTCKCG